MDARIGRRLRESNESGRIKVAIPFVLYRELQWYLRAIDCPTKPDDLIADIIRGYLHKLNL